MTPRTIPSSLSPIANRHRQVLNMKVLFLTLVACTGLALQAGEQPARKLNVLAVCAHPDDELSAGCTLRKYARLGHNVFIAYTTSGNTGSNILTDTKEIEKKREAEALEACKIFNAKVRFLRNDDERLLDTNETRTQVLDALRWADPDVIFTHSPVDPSPDHRMTSQLVRDMIISMPGRNQQSNEKPCAKHPSIFTWLPVKGLGELPEVFVEVSEEDVNAVAEAMKIHNSQVNYMKTLDGPTRREREIPPKKIQTLFWGLQGGCKYAEVFRAVRILRYMPDFRLLP